MTVLDELVHSVGVRRIGTVVERVQEVGYPDYPPLSVYLNAGVIPRSDRSDNHNVLGADLSKYQRVLPGDIVFNRLRTWQGGFGASRHEGIVSPAYIVVRPRGGDARFLDYLLHSAPYLAELTRISKWMPPSQFDVLWNDLRQVEVPWPATTEQRRIADFLDDRVSRIDRIIAARNSQDSLIAQWQQSYLSRIMDRQVAASGVAPLRRFCSGIEQGSSPVAEDRPAEPGECGVLKTSSIFRGAFFSQRYKSILLDDPDPRHRVQSRDVIVVRGSGSADLVGDAAMAMLEGENPPLYLSDLTYRLRGLKISPEYAVLAIISARGRSELGSRVRQGSGPAKARGDDIMAISVPVASTAEQLACVNEASSARSRSAAHSLAIRRSIDLLAEYKMSLITAAVTGELDVTTAGSNIPG